MIFFDQTPVDFHLFHPGEDRDAAVKKHLDFLLKFYGELPIHVHELAAVWAYYQPTEQYGFVLWVSSYSSLERT